MENLETISRWEQPPVWNGKAETWGDWEREVTLWTDSFDSKKRRRSDWSELVRSLSHLHQAYEVGLSVPRAELVKNTGVETLLTALRHSGLARKVSMDIAAKLRGFRGQRKPTQQ